MTSPSPEGSRESKVLFVDAERPRTIKGMITSEDDHFIVLSRRDGEVRIAKRYIIKIETRGGRCK